jgi:hypothetical protein
MLKLNDIILILVIFCVVMLMNSKSLAFLSKFACRLDFY